MLFSALLWLDIKLFVVITLGNCKRGETMSAAAYQGEKTGKIMGRIFRPVIDLLFSYWQKRHCYNAWIWQAELYK